MVNFAGRSPHIFSQPLIFNPWILNPSSFYVFLVGFVGTATYPHVWSSTPDLEHPSTFQETSHDGSTPFCLRPVFGRFPSEADHLTAQRAHRFQDEAEAETVRAFEPGGRPGGSWYAGSTCHQEFTSKMLEKNPSSTPHWNGKPQNLSLFQDIPRPLQLVQLEQLTWCPSAKHQAHMYKPLHEELKNQVGIDLEFYSWFIAERDHWNCQHPLGIRCKPLTETPTGRPRHLVAWCGCIYRSTVPWDETRP